MCKNYACFPQIYNENSRIESTMFGQMTNDIVENQSIFLAQRNQTKNCAYGLLHPQPSRAMPELRNIFHFSQELTKSGRKQWKQTDDIVNISARLLANLEYINICNYGLIRGAWVMYVLIETISAANHSRINLFRFCVHECMLNNNK